MTSVWHIALTHKHLLNWTDWPCVWKPSVTLASLSHSPWLSSCLPGVLLFNLLFSCQYLTWKWSSLFHARPSSLLPGPIFFGALSYSNYYLHADVSQILICSLILLLRFRLTCSTLWNWMSHMHSESICPKFISSSCLLPFQSYFILFIFSDNDALIQKSAQAGKLEVILTSLSS